MLNRSFIRIAVACLGLLTVAAPAAHAENQIFDELRFGAVSSIAAGDNDEEGAFITGMVLFDPWNRDALDGWQRILTPRIHVGGDIATSDEANQVFAGFSWTADLGDRFFLEGGFGGSVNDGDLEEDGTSGPKLGSHLLFHEYAAFGINIDANWRVIAEVEHSSHANIADGPNNGLSRAGVLVGYKF